VRIEVKGLVKQNIFSQINAKPEDTLLNFCLIFKTTLANFEEIKGTLLRSGAALIYQTKSADRIYITKEGEN
jgi:hypothetical protein